jgi:phage terminase large subunit GpA-like protein
MIALAEPSTGTATLLSEWQEWGRCWLPQPLRSLREFAESEIIIPDGPFKNWNFKVDRQPWAGLWFDAIDSGLFQRFAATGPSQSGKTLCCYVIPTMFHLFEIGETVICGVPKMEMAHDKWTQDFLPAIKASRYADLLPERGKGSRGGNFESITFRNGATLKFMTGGGDDKSRAGFTSRVVVITEVDGLDKSAELSREADPIKQLEARTRSYGHRRRIYLECTVSTEAGKIWQEYKQGTESRIALPCPHCGEFVSPERGHLLGWQGVENEFVAEEKARFFCPECATGWSEEQRRAANVAARLVHRGQVIGTDGAVCGDPPQTRTLGFRWSGVNNLFTTAAELGAEEWKSSKELDEENADRERKQFVWCEPVQPSASEVSGVTVDAIMSRTGPHAKGVLPPGCQAITVGIDIGKHLIHWVAKAWDSHPTGYTIDYAVQEVHSTQLGEDIAIASALRELRDLFVSGWKRGDVMVAPDVIFVDSGNWTETVYRMCQEFGLPFYPTKGFSTTQYGQTTKYHKSSNAIQSGDGWHLAKVGAVDVVEIDADAWKSRVHSRLECHKEKPFAVQLFQSEPREHLKYAKHLTAEKKVEEFVVGRGLVTRWEKIRKDNHWLDCEAMAHCAADAAGVKGETIVVPVESEAEAKRRFVRSLAMRGGQR